MLCQQQTTQLCVVRMVFINWSKLSLTRNISLDVKTRAQQNREEREPVVVRGTFVCFILCTLPDLSKNLYLLLNLGKLINFIAPHTKISQKFLTIDDHFVIAHLLFLFVFYFHIISSMRK